MARWKRVLDVLLGGVFMSIGAVIIAVLWLIVRLDGGPGFFGHTRIGKHGRLFRCWKIRTMVPDAERHLSRHLADDPNAAAEWRDSRKLRRDPRITRLGGVLRRTSLDELPQLWNVMRGDMSLVGPRPVTFDEIEKYGAARWAYLAMKPGITGLWQVSGRNDVSYRERVRLDVEYLDRGSLRTDLGILLRTVAAVFRRSGH